MIIVRSPLRLSLGGGGTDLPSYYSKFGGFLIAGAIDKYIYITVHETFQNLISLKYSEIEVADKLDKIKHPLFRETLRFLNLDNKNLEIVSVADIPSGTGLGSSGSFTTGLLRALHSYRKDYLSPKDLAEEACHIEIDILKDPVGKQDQYISAIGGLTCFEFAKDGKVTVSPLEVKKEVLYQMEENLLMFFTGFSRSASAILKDQHERSMKSEDDILKNLHFVKELGYKSREALESGNLTEFANIMDIHWEHKRLRSPNMSNQKIDQWYAKARSAGALGGKLIGAGGGGFLLFYTEDKLRLRRAMREVGLSEVRFRFDFEGTKVISS